MDILSPEHMEKLFLFAHDAHTKFNVRGQDHILRRGLYPYMVHCMWAASTLAMDPEISEGERVLGFQILLLHDVLEDTTKTLPDWIDEDVKKGVYALTHDNWEDEQAAAEHYTPFLKLLKLCDKMQTLYERSIQDPQKQKEWKAFTESLLQDVVKRYGNTRITVIARALLDDTQW